MYSSITEWVRRDRRHTRRRVRVPQTVVLLGVTSMLTDVSSEMVTAVLPLYLTYELSFTALQFGAVVGLSEAVQAVARIGGGFAADRKSRYKGIALTGYSMSACTRVGVLVSGGAWAALTGVLLADRVGKGIRTAPRDAMISLASPTAELGRSFGVHRAFDALGALAGPLVAFAILAALPEAFDAVFLVSFSFAIVGVAVLALFVPRRPARSPDAQVGRRALFLGLASNRRLWRIALAASLLGLLTIGDAFVFLGYRRSADFGIEFFPLLFTGVALVYLVLAVPVGRLADRIGRRRVFLGGYAVLGLVYFALLSPPPGALGLLAIVGGLGLFYAATDGVLMAATSALLTPDQRASGLATVATASTFGRFGAAILFGAIWSTNGPSAAFAGFAIAIPVALVVAWRLIRSMPDASQPSGDVTT